MAAPPSRKSVGYTQHKAGLLALIRSDFARFPKKSQKPLAKIKLIFESLVFKANFQAVFLYRISHWLFELGLVYPAWFVARMNQALTGADIEFNAEIGEGMFISHPSGIVIGRGTKIGARVTLYQGVTFGLKEWDTDAPRVFPQVGDRCRFFAHAVIIGGVKIGHDCTVAAQALISRDVSDGHIANSFYHYQLNTAK